MATRARRTTAAARAAAEAELADAYQQGFTAGTVGMDADEKRVEAVEVLARSLQRASRAYTGNGEGDSLEAIERAIVRLADQVGR